MSISELISIAQGVEYIYYLLRRARDILTYITMLSYPESSFKAGNGVNPNLNHTTNNRMTMILQMKCSFYSQRKSYV